MHREPAARPCAACHQAPHVPERPCWHQADGTCFFGLRVAEASVEWAPHAKRSAPPLRHRPRPFQVRSNAPAATPSTFLETALLHDRKALSGLLSTRR